MKRRRGYRLLFGFTFIALSMSISACGLIDQGGSLPKPSRNIAYVRSVVEDDNGLYAIDVDSDQVIGGPLLLGRETHGPNNSTAMAPNGKVYTRRVAPTGIVIPNPFSPFRHLLILDPDKGWQRAELSLPVGVHVVETSPDGKALIARQAKADRQAEFLHSMQIEVYDTSNDALIKTEKVIGVVSDIYAAVDGLIYVGHGSDLSDRRLSDSIHNRTSDFINNPPLPAGITVIRSSDLRTLAEIPLKRYFPTDLALGPDGLLYGTVERRLAPGESELDYNAEWETTGLLVAIDPNAQQVVAELEVHNGACELAITPDGKAYILHHNPVQGGQPSQVSVYDLKQRKLLKELPIGKAGSFIKQVGPNKVYAATKGYHEEKGKIWVIDTSSDSIVKTFEVGNMPEAIAMLPNPAIFPLEGRKPPSSDEQSQSPTPSASTRPQTSPTPTDVAKPAPLSASPAIDQLPAPIVSMAADPRDASRVYALLMTNALYRSDDGGRSWRALQLPPPGRPDEAPVTETPLEFPFGSDRRNHVFILPQRDLVAPPDSPNRVFVLAGRMLFRSDDGGDSWQRLADWVNAWTTADSAGNVLYAWRPVLPQNMGGLYRSQDGGESWQRVRAGCFPPGIPEEAQCMGNHSGITSLAASPLDPDTVYAGTDFGLYRSNDGGKTWEQFNAGLPPTVRPYRWTPMLVGGADGAIYGLTEAFPSAMLHEAELIRLRFGETAFQTLEPGLPHFQEANEGFCGFHTLVADPLRAGRLYLGSTVGLLISDDGGKSWSLEPGPNGRAVYRAAVSQNDPSRVYAWTDAGWDVYDTRNSEWLIKPVPSPSAGQLRPAPLSGDDVTNLDRARQALIQYFTLLNSRDYYNAVKLYGGSYETLQYWNPLLSADDQATLFKQGCEINGLQCLPLKRIVAEEYLSPAQEQFRFTVEFVRRDGNLFVVGQCCGASEKEVPLKSQFPYTVKKVGDRFFVQELPIYVP